MEAFITFVVFLLVAGLILCLNQILAIRRRRRRRVEVEEDGAPRGMILGDMTPALAAQIPITRDNRSDLQRELRIAGFYRPTAVVEYAAVRTLLTVPPILAAGILALFVPMQNQVAWCWVIGIVLALLGYSLPRLYIYYRGRARSWEIERGLPIALDMINLCLSAGLNVLNSLERILRELYHAYPVLAFELDIVRRQAELRTLNFALMQFADRSGLPNVRNLAVILSQSENLGTDTVVTLTEYSDSMRTSMRQRAEESANKAPFKLLFPAYLMAIGAAILIISPTVLEFNVFRRQNTIKKLNEESVRSFVPEKAEPLGQPDNLTGP